MKTLQKCTCHFLYLYSKKQTKLKATGISLHINITFGLPSAIQRFPELLYERVLRWSRRRIWRIAVPSFTHKSARLKTPRGKTYTSVNLDIDREREATKIKTQNKPSHLWTSVIKPILHTLPFHCMIYKLLWTGIPCNPFNFWMASFDLQYTAMLPYTRGN